MIKIIDLKQAGIYKITNIKNNKSYIGSAVFLNKRKNHHFSSLNLNKHHSPYLQRTYNKYGKEIFKFEVLATCPKEYLIKLEQWFIDNLKPEYNTCKVAGSQLGYKHKKETIQKMKESSNKITKETRLRILKARDLIIQKPMIQYSLTGEFIKEWNSFKEYVTITGDNNKNIVTACKGRLKTASGFIFKYKNI